MEAKIVKQKRIEELVKAWDAAEKDIRLAVALLHGAQTSLQTAFLPSSESSLRVFDGYRNHSGNSALATGNADELITDLRRGAWKVLVERMEVRKVMSLAAIEALEKRLAAKEVPAITVQEVWGQFASAMENVSTFHAEAVAEVYEWLRPSHRVHGKNYKVNSEFGIGPKVVLSYMLECCKFTGRVSISYHGKRRERLTCLDRVFHGMDGQGLPSTYHGPLSDAIDKACSEGTLQGETDYFRFKCCKNGNIHLEFKRLDLVQEFNRIAGSGMLAK